MRHSEGNATLAAVCYCYC